MKAALQSGGDAMTAASRAAADAPVRAGAAPRQVRRAAVLRWLRRAHGWLGLWGALVGLMFGATGIVMNHRAILPLPLKKIEKTSAQIALAQPPQDAQALADMLQFRLGFEGRPPRLKIEPAITVYWNDRPVTQPERWQVWLEAPQRYARADYYVGNRYASIETFDPNLIATLTRLHQAIGVSALWVLFADSIAGSMVLLALSGLALWSRLEPRRAAGLVLGLASLGLAGACLLV